MIDGTLCLFEDKKSADNQLLFVLVLVLCNDLEGITFLSIFVHVSIRKHRTMGTICLLIAC